jgi:hypothetical protein
MLVNKIKEFDTIYFMDKKKINCLHCKHYYNTWDPKSPRGCRLFSFKGPHFPSQSVLRETGQECEGFSANAKFKASSAKLDLNSDDLW